MTGRFQINVTPEDADIVYVSESGPPDPANAAKLDRRVYETAAPAVWFLAVTSRAWPRPATSANGVRRSALKPDVMRVSGGYKVALAAIPRAAVIRATFDGSDPRAGPVVPTGEIDAPKGARQLACIAEVDGSFSQEESAPLGGGHEEVREAHDTAEAGLKPDAPVTDLALRAEGHCGSVLCARSPGQNSSRQGFGRIDRIEWQTVGRRFPFASPWERCGVCGREPRPEGQGIGELLAAPRPR